MRFAAALGALVGSIYFNHSQGYWIMLFLMLWKIGSLLQDIYILKAKKGMNEHRY